MIKLTRVDYRLIHGQVAMSWTHALDVDCILCASDAVAKDDMRKAALRLGIQFLIDEFDINEVYLGVKFQNIVAKKLYSSYGFIETGETTDTALEMKLIISKK